MYSEILTFAGIGWPAGLHCNLHRVGGNWSLLQGKGTFIPDGAAWT